jgi:hypothetical protein
MLISVFEVLTKMRTREQVLLRDYQRWIVVKLRVETMCAEEAQTRVSKVQAIDHLFRIHNEDYMPELVKYDRFLRETVIYFSDSKVQTSLI